MLLNLSKCLWCIPRMCWPHEIGTRWMKLWSRRMWEVSLQFCGWLLDSFASIGVMKCPKVQNLFELFGTAAFLLRNSIRILSSSWIKKVSYDCLLLNTNRDCLCCSNLWLNHILDPSAIAAYLRFIFYLSDGFDFFIHVFIIEMSENNNYH